MTDDNDEYWMMNIPGAIRNSNKVLREQFQSILKEISPHSFFLYYQDGSRTLITGLWEDEED